MPLIDNKKILYTSNGQKIYIKSSSLFSITVNFVYDTFLSPINDYLIKRNKKEEIKIITEKCLEL